MNRRWGWGGAEIELNAVSVKSQHDRKFDMNKNNRKQGTEKQDWKKNELPRPLKN